MKKFNPADSLIGNIKARLWRRNKSFIVLYHGDLGEGKSYSGMALALKIQPDWTLDNLVFLPSEFVARMRSPDLKRGNALIWDEAGVGLSARDWMSIQNKLIGAILQTCRTKNICLIVTTPSESFVDIQMRRLFNCIIEPFGINYKKNYCECKILLVQVNKQTGKIYRKFPRIRFPDNIMRRMPYIYFHKPPARITKLYDAMRNKFTDELNEKAERIIKDLEDKEEGKVKPRLEGRKMFRKGHTTKEIAKEFDVDLRTAQRWVSNMRLR